MNTAAPGVTFLARYPVKGLSAQPAEALELEEGRPVPGDRVFAIEDGPSGFDPEHPRHLPKYKFLTLMRHPRLAGIASRYNVATGVLELERDGHLVAAGDLCGSAGRQAIEHFLMEEFGEVARGALRIVRAPAGMAFTDVAEGAVSLINLASIRTIAARAGRRDLDAGRFRANIGVDGLPPWGEVDLIGREIGLGTARLRVTEAIERCAATHADPRRGLRDLDLVGLMQREFGHSVCGVYAEVIRAGIVRTGDAMAG